MLTIALILGGALVGLVGVQLGLVGYTTLRGFVDEGRGRRLSLELLRERIAAAKVQRVLRQQAVLHWNGYRKFVVEKKCIEAAGICSFYLVPHDRKMLPDFKPGQYLTFRINVPGREKPVVRCYSLSDRPQLNHYRVTIKRVPPPPDTTDVPPGLISNFFHDNVNESDILDVQAPGGQFVLDPLDRRPAVLIAGGVGITPMVSMLNTIAETKSQREAWLYYAVRNGREHAFKDQLRRLTEEHENIRVVVCYSHPDGNDVRGRDYDHEGRLSVAVMKQDLASSNYQFFLCGPPGMMESMSQQMREWKVPNSDILSEAFGPATVSKAFAKPQMAEAAAAKPATATAVKVVFDKSKKELSWNPQAENLLEFALENGIQIESGCRAGNCGTCLVAIKSGRVDYLAEHGAEPEEGACLTCICRPESDLILDA